VGGGGGGGLFVVGGGGGGVLGVGVVLFVGWGCCGWGGLCVVGVCWEWLKARLERSVLLEGGFGHRKNRPRHGKLPWRRGGVSGMTIQEKADSSKWRSALHPRGPAYGQGKEVNWILNLSFKGGSKEPGY